MSSPFEKTGAKQNNDFRGEGVTVFPRLAAHLFEDHTRLEKRIEAEKQQHGDFPHNLKEIAL